MDISIVQDVDKAISVMYGAGKWLEEAVGNLSKWWQPQNLNREFLLKYARHKEFFVLLVDGKPAAAAILQLGQNAQDWRSIDKGRDVKALYIHWLCVARKFAGKGFSKKIIDFAKEYARKNNVNLLRVDTNADEEKLRKIYEDLGFKLVAVKQESYRKTAFYEMGVT